MAQPDWLTLDGGEEIVWTGRPRTMSIAGTVVGAVVRVGVVLIVVVALMTGVVDALLPATVPTITELIPPFVLPLVAVLAVGYAVLKIGWALVRIRNVDYVLTTENLYKKTGVASENVTRIGLGRIQRTSLSKDFTGNLFDYGTVDISTAGSSGIEMRIADLNDPDELRNELRRRSSEASGPSGASGAATAAAPAAAGLDEATLRQLLGEARELRETVASIEEVLEG